MKTRSRNCYDTAIILLFILGKEHLLPQEMIRSIPCSTKSGWRNYAIEKFVGAEHRNILNEGIRNAELYTKYRHIKKVLRVVEQVYTALADMIDFVKLPLYKVEKYKERILDLIQFHQPVMGLEKLLCVFRISKSTYQNWLLSIKVKCMDSYFFSCVRRHGSQLLKKEVETMKNALEDSRFIHWPVVSIAYYFQRKNLLHASVSTWYKYRRLLGIERKRLKKKIKTKGIASTYCNEYWHIDITHFTTANGIKHFIYFLSDNFSRKILSWRIGFSVDWKLVRACIREAYEKATAMKNPLQLKIVSDGGPENTNKGLCDFVSSLNGKIEKLIALKDIEFSNSPAEAVNRTFKMYYASESETENTAALYGRVEFYVNDVNTVRPSNPLKGFTPDEVYYNQKPDINFRELRMQQAQIRKTCNQVSTCKACELI